jgi:hypothetical protein
MSVARVAGPEVGAQVAELGSMTSQVGRAGGVLSEAGGELAGVLAAARLPAGSATTVQATGEWALAAAGGLRRRLTMFKQADRSGTMLTARQAGFGGVRVLAAGEVRTGVVAGPGRRRDKAALATLLFSSGFIGTTMAPAASAP